MRAIITLKAAFIFSLFFGVVCANIFLCVVNGISDDKKSVESSDRAWLFIYFTNKGNDGLYYAWSNDGLLWQPIRDGKPFLRPEVGGEAKERVMRSPAVCKGVDGTYHIVWTTGKETKSIGYASSKDMINWSKQKLIPVMEHEKNARNTWDPELFYDDESKRFYIIWASTVTGSFKETDGTGEGNFNNRLYYTTTPDFAEFAQTKLYWNPDHNVIDPLLIENKNGKASERYLLFYKDETFKPTPKKHLLLATGASPTGTFNVQKVVSHTDWVQGASVLRIDGDWYLYYDCYAKRHFGAVKSNDLQNWTNITEKLCFPTNARQGTIIEIDKETLKKLQELK
ncbi:MAG: glycoside hydrolase family 43 protein [Planctomycetaceae bacterium]|jgi:beta-xylosidase|nr:glycoside hydrolase family 43 protein [Planctomycetaceae bacterium]